MAGSKYNAKKVMVDGIKFDSEMESNYYVYLKYQKKIGKIKDFELQPEFILMDKFKKDGKNYMATKYKADFRVIHNDDSIEIVDVKGMITPVFAIKVKMFHSRYEEKLSLVTWSKIDGGWIDHDALKKARKARKEAKGK